MFEDGKEIDTLYPAQVVLPQARGGADDRGRDPPRARPRTSTSCCGGFDLADADGRRCEIVVNPLVNWIWFGFGVLAIGTGIALLPERTFAFALAKLPAEAATTTATLLLSLLLVARRRRARRSADEPATRHADVVLRANAAREAAAARDRLHLRRLRPQHASPSAARMPCATSHEMRGELAALIDQGKIARRDHPGASSRSTAARRCSARRSTRASTASPGCSRTCVGATGAVARRLRRRCGGRASRDDAAAERAAPTDPALDERLDDELRNLD